MAASVHTVKKCRKSPGECGRCGKKIKKGEPYIHWKFRYGGKRIRCLECPRPRYSELIFSGKLSAIEAAREGIQDAIEAFRGDHDSDSLRSALETAAEDVRQVAEEYRESAQNIEDGFGHSTQQCDDLNERADAVEAGADQIESAAGDLEDFEEEVEEGETEEAKAKRKEEWVEEQAGKAEEAEQFETD